MIEYDLILMSLVIFLPAAFGLTCLFFPAKFKEAVRWWALLGTAATLCLSLCIVVEYYFLLDSRSDRGLRSLHHPSTLLDARADEAMRRASLDAPAPRQGYDWVGAVPWIDRFDIQYCVGIDGISLPLIVLTSLIMFFAVIASWKIETNVSAYFFLLLTLQTGVLGTFFALDLFLLYVFYEVMLIPMYFLIGLWGGARRKYAAFKFVIYTLLGSVFLLVAVIGLYFTDVRDFVDKTAVEARAQEVRKTNPRLTNDEIRQYHTFHIPTLQRAGQAGDQGRLAGPVLADQRRAGVVEQEGQVLEHGLGTVVKTGLFHTQYGLTRRHAIAIPLPGVSRLLGRGLVHHRRSGNPRRGVRAVRRHRSPPRPGDRSALQRRGF